MWVRVDLQSSYQIGSSLFFQMDERWISLLPIHGSRCNVIIVVNWEMCLGDSLLNLSTPLNRLGLQGCQKTEIKVSRGSQGQEGLQ